MQNTQPKLHKIRGGLFPKYRLEEEYKYKFLHNGHISAFTVPKGFEYDGASFGSFLFWRKDMHDSPHTLVHDWGYGVKGNVEAHYLHNGEHETGFKFSLTKKEVDDLFLQGARRDENIQNWRTYIASGVFKTIAWLYWIT